MQALVYNGPYEVDLEQVQDPRIEHPNDVTERFDRRERGYTKVARKPAA